MNYEQKYKEAMERAKKELQTCGSTDCDAARQIFRLFPELVSEDERIRKALINKIKDLDEEEAKEGYSFYADDYTADDCIAWLEKQGEKSQGKSITKVWKDMRLEVFAQASGNRHEPNYSYNNAKIFSLNDIDEIIEKISEQNLANSAKTCKDDK